MPGLLKAKVLAEAIQTPIDLFSIKNGESNDTRPCLNRDNRPFKICKIRKRNQSKGLQDSIKVLNTVDTAKSAEDIVQQLQAIKQVLQYIEHVNIADDFQQLGGVDVVWKCLCSGNTEIRIGGCSMVVELSESDPSTQKLVTQQRIIGALVDIIEHPNGPTPGKMLIRRAYHAVSALMGRNVEAICMLKEIQGIPY